MHRCETRIFHPRGKNMLSETRQSLVSDSIFWPLGWNILFSPTYWPGHIYSYTQTPAEFPCLYLLVFTSTCLSLLVTWHVNKTVLDGHYFGFSSKYWRQLLFSNVLNLTSWFCYVKTSWRHVLWLMTSATSPCCQACLATTLDINLSLVNKLAIKLAFAANLKVKTLFTPISRPGAHDGSFKMTVNRMDKKLTDKSNLMTKLTLVTRQASFLTTFSSHSGGISFSRIPRVHSNVISVAPPMWNFSVSHGYPTLPELLFVYWLLHVVCSVYKHTLSTHIISVKNVAIWRFCRRRICGEEWNKVHLGKDSWSH